jgi:serralysin
VPLQVQHVAELQRIQGSFDGLKYIASNPDLIAAFGADQDAGAGHYITNGFREGRATDGFDAAQYLDNYSDLQAVFGTNEEAATIHYITYGFYEGRVDVVLA